MPASQPASHPSRAWAAGDVVQAALDLLDVPLHRRRQHRAVPRRLHQRAARAMRGGRQAGATQWHVQAPEKSGVEPHQGPGSKQCAAGAARRGTRRCAPPGACAARLAQVVEAQRKAEPRDVAALPQLGQHRRPLLQLPPAAHLRRQRRGGWQEREGVRKWRVWGDSQGGGRSGGCTVVCMRGATHDMGGSLAAPGGTPHLLGRASLAPPAAHLVQRHGILHPLTAGRQGSRNNRRLGCSAQVPCCR